MTSDDSANHASKPSGPTVLKVPDGDTHERLVCETCGFIHYKNPVVVVGSVCVWGDKLLLCRRAIDPRRGFWTIPAGYLELEETTAEGARREALEEACVEIEIEALLAVYDIPRISQVQIMYAARLAGPEIAPGVESLETRLMDFSEIPWDDLAFPSVHWALHHHREYISGAPYAVRGNPETNTKTP